MALGGVAVVVAPGGVDAEQGWSAAESKSLAISTVEHVEAQPFEYVWAVAHEGRSFMSHFLKHWSIAVGPPVW